jgi:hypothetical protein
MNCSGVINFSLLEVREEVYSETGKLTTKKSGSFIALYS